MEGVGGQGVSISTRIHLGELHQKSLSKTLARHWPLGRMALACSRHFLQLILSFLMASLKDDSWAHLAPHASWDDRAGHGEG